MYTQDKRHIHRICEIFEQNCGNLHGAYGNGHVTLSNHKTILKTLIMSIGFNSLFLLRISRMDCVQRLIHSAD